MHWENLFWYVMLLIRKKHIFNPKNVTWFSIHRMKFLCLHYSFNTRLLFLNISTCNVSQTLIFFKIVNMSYAMWTTYWKAKVSLNIFSSTIKICIFKIAEGSLMFSCDPMRTCVKQSLRSQWNGYFFLILCLFFVCLFLLF